jgi:hypothetical protein
MKEERFVTVTERGINERRREKMASPDNVFSLCGVKVLSEVYKACGGKAALLYFALLGNSNVAGASKSFKFLNSFLEAAELNKADLSKATTKLETAGYITVERKSGHKNLITLTEKGRRGLVNRR